MSEQGRKYDGGKLRYDLIPVLALEEVARVVTKGAEKYDDENWKLVPEGRRRYLAAAMRHIQQWRKGEIYDEEMGTHHIANAISNLMFILEKELRGWGDVSETPEIVKAEKVIVMPLHYHTPCNEEDRKVRDFYVDSAKEVGAVVAFGSKENVLKENSSDEQLEGIEEDISEDVLNNYLNTLNVKVVDDKFQVTPRLWYPPVEEGGNPWIEYDGSGQPVSNEVFVEILYRYEREEKDWYECCERAKCWPWVWNDTECDQIVAYRIVD